MGRQQQLLNQILQLRNQTSRGEVDMGGGDAMLQQLQNLEAQLADMKGVTPADESRLARVQQIRAAAAAQQQNDPRTQQAAQLEAQANQPYPQPHGLKENLISGVRAGLEGLSGQYFEREAQRQAQFRQGQLDARSQAERLRNDARQGQRDNLDFLRIVNDEDQQRATQDYRNQELNLQREQAEQGRFTSSPMGVINTRTGEVTTPPVEKPTKATHVGSYTNERGENVQIFQNPDGSLSQREMGKVQPPVSHMEQQTTARLDRSYDKTKASLDKMAQPITALNERLFRFMEGIRQGTPQSQALLAPELLTIMAGGQGTGLRMTEAEISRIVGGRSNWEQMKAWAQRWSADPAKAGSLTPEQVGQMKALGEEVQKRVQRQLGELNSAYDQLLDAGSVEEHRRIETKVRQSVTNPASTETNTSGAQRLKRTNKRTGEVQFSDDAGATWHK
jgi:hypothetical protein